MSDQNDSPWEGIAQQQRELAARWAKFQLPQFKFNPIIFPKIPDYSKFLQNALEPFKRIWEHHNRFSWVENAGWLPHSTMPEEAKLGSDWLPEETEIRFQAHYRDNWAIVRTRFQTSVSALNIDDEAKQTFEEALQCHEQGLYRCAPCLLFPEIERVIRVEIHGGAMDKMAQLDRFRDMVGELGMTELSEDDFLGGLRFYLKMDGHMYTSAKNEDVFEKIKSGPIPNRHAVVHGYVKYSTFKSSINALIFGDYMLRLVHLIKSQSEPVQIRPAAVL